VGGPRARLLEDHTAVDHLASLLAWHGGALEVSLHGGCCRDAGRRAICCPVARFFCFFCEGGERILGEKGREGGCLSHWLRREIEGGRGL
jgi:hypothetical protein